MITDSSWPPDAPTATISSGDWKKGIGSSRRGRQWRSLAVPGGVVLPSQVITTWHAQITKRSGWCVNMQSKAVSEGREKQKNDKGWKGSGRVMYEYPL